MTVPAGGWSGMEAFNFFYQTGSGGCGWKLMPAEVSARIESLSNPLIVEHGGFLRRHSANRVLDHGFRFIHVLVSLPGGSFCRRPMRILLFLGALVNQEGHQGYHRHDNHRPKQHSAAGPTAHPSVSLVHHFQWFFPGALVASPPACVTL